jgi:hypothetical protein
MDGLLTFRLTSIAFKLTNWLPHRRRHRHRHRHQSSIIIIFPVHLLFKWNIYLSLLCDWILFFLQIHFSFSFLPSLQLKHVILIPTADIVHFSSHVQASHLMHVFLCC